MLLSPAIDHPVDSADVRGGANRKRVGWGRISPKLYDINNTGRTAKRGCDVIFRTVFDPAGSKHCWRTHVQACVRQRGQGRTALTLPPPPAWQLAARMKWAVPDICNLLLTSGDVSYGGHLTRWLAVVFNAVHHPLCCCQRGVSPPSYRKHLFPLRKFLPSWWFTKHKSKRFFFLCSKNRSSDGNSN